MTGLDFLAVIVRASVDLLTAIAWPVAGVVIALIFRREIHRLLHDLRSLKMGPFDAHFRKELDEAQAIATEISIGEGLSDSNNDPEVESFIKLDQLAMSAHPTGVIMESWKGVESLLNAVAKSNQVPAWGHSQNKSSTTDRRSQPYFPMAERALFRAKVINQEGAELISKLRHIRNQVAHSRNFSLSDDEVREYVNLAQTAERYLAPLLRPQIMAP